jgi:hypothetical protein
MTRNPGRQPCGFEEAPGDLRQHRVGGQRIVGGVRHDGELARGPQGAIEPGIALAASERLPELDHVLGPDGVRVGEDQQCARPEGRHPLRIEAVLSHRRGREHEPVDHVRVADGGLQRDAGAQRVAHHVDPAKVQMADQGGHVVARRLAVQRPVRVRRPPMRLPASCTL